MNHKFRKKPVVIEAFQMTEARGSDNRDWPSWLNEAWNKRLEEPGCLYLVAPAPTTRAFRIRTLEGVHAVTWGDWIIRGVAGELYPCKPDIFEATYEPAESTPEGT